PLVGEAPVLAAGHDDPQLFAPRRDLDQEAAVGAVLPGPARADLAREREVDGRRQLRTRLAGAVCEHALHERLAGALAPVGSERALEQGLVDALVAQVADEEMRDPPARVGAEHGRVAAVPPEHERLRRAPARAEELELVLAARTDLARPPAPAATLGTRVAVHVVGVAALEAREVELLGKR